MVLSWPRGRRAARDKSAEAEVEVEAEAAVSNTMSSMILQASELATAEAGGNVDAAALGDMEVTLRELASQNTDRSNDDTDDAVQTPMKTKAISVVVMAGQDAEESCEMMEFPPQRSTSPTTQFECDILNATHSELDVDSLQKNHQYSRALFDDDEDKSVSSTQNDNESLVSEDAASANDISNSKVKEDEDLQNFVDDILSLSPVNDAADYMFCQLQCAFPDVVKDANEIMSTELHHFMFPEEEEEEEKDAKEEEGGVLALKSDGGGDDQEESDNQGGNEEDMILVFGPHLDEEEEGDERETDDEHEEDDVGGREEIVVDEQKDSLEVDVILGRWVKMQHQFDRASYSPGQGFVLRKDVKMPELSEDEVLIRVDATAISTRDCLERLRRDNNKDLKDDVWVPGHEIVGHVVRAGSGVEAKSLLDERVASVLPYGGGCSQYVCIHAKDAIALSEEADSNDVVGLLSTYMIAHQCLECVAGIESREEEDDDVAAAEDIDAEAEDDDAEVEASPSKNMDDAEQKRSHLFGKTVVIVDSGSPVGLALVNLATNAGATVYTVTDLIPTLDAIKWSCTIDLIVDVVGGSDNNQSYSMIMKPRGRLVRVNTTSCGEKYVPLAGKIKEEKDTSYYGRVIKDKAIDYDIFHSFDEDKEVFAEDLAYLTDLCSTSMIEPIVFSHSSFDEMEGKWGKLMVKGGNGVVVVSPWKLGFTTVISEES